MGKGKTHYQVLGCAPSSNAVGLHLSYLKLARLHHPDKGGDTATFQEITEAWGVLKDADRRKQYDAELALLRKACGKCNGAGTISKQKSFTQVVKVPCTVCDGVGYK